ncbi:Haloacid Dehalogenase Superfamily Class (subfamily) IIA [Nocardioides terrae]|uniref:Haloacid Dehalogenase Superfamily Class (Subfamily) IIA n=1 Tax=Nocardioides terrae TaxID=574651 RepID=A0A1I1P1D5_9ACTN|nr:HAD-IIA family hydrolase [Nocardioides terrae]SFC99770.1 Haloacid Dehalogenase Superfamily Class (subfamily) IIA [Nocardioides terrae]
MLGASEQPLCEAYDLAMLDLDGVVYVGGEAVPGAPDHLETVRARGQRLAFITNNASRPPEVVAAHLTELGVQAGADDVVTSAQAAARVLRDRLGEGARVVVLGAEGLLEALKAEGLVPVGVADEAEALVTGYDPDLVWRDLMHGAVLVQDGLWWVASNSDLTIPTPYGVAPGHGVLVDMLRRFTGVEPDIAGKPARPLLDETVRRVGGTRPLMVGDRLDTDIAGAHAAGVDSLLVLTGVSGLGDLAGATPDLRPTYISADLAGLLVTHPKVTVAQGRCSLGGWEAVGGERGVEVTGSGSVDDWWRAVASVCWWWLDTSGAAADVSRLTPPR